MPAGAADQAPPDRWYLVYKDETGKLVNRGDFLGLQGEVQRVQVAQAAFKLIDAEGGAALTMPRLARELAAMEQVDEPTALKKIHEILNKAAAIYNKDKVPAGK